MSEESKNIRFTLVFERNPHSNKRSFYTKPLWVRRTCPSDSL